MWKFNDRNKEISERRRFDGCQQRKILCIFEGERVTADVVWQLWRDRAASVRGATTKQEHRGGINSGLVTSVFSLAFHGVPSLSIVFFHIHHHPIVREPCEALRCVVFFLSIHAAHTVYFSLLYVFPSCTQIWLIVFAQSRLSSSAWSIVVSRHGCTLRANRKKKDEEMCWDCRWHFSAYCLQLP